MNKTVFIFLFELLLAIVFVFFYLSIWTSNSPDYASISERFKDTGLVAALHMIFGIGGALVINTK